MVGSGEEEEGGRETWLWACKANKMRERIVSLSFGWGSRQGGKDTRHAARGVDAAVAAAAVAATCGALQIFEMKLKSNKGTAERDTHTQTLTHTHTH